MGVKRWFKEKTNGKINYIIKTINWFDKSINAFSCRYIIDGVESEKSFIFSIPFLFKFYITLSYDNEYFVSKYERLYKNDSYIEWGYVIDTNYITFSWDREVELSEAKGFSFVKDWGAIIKGKVVKVIRTEPVRVLSTSRNILTGYKISNYPKELRVFYVGKPDLIGISVPFDIYRRSRTFKYKRWWDVTIYDFDVVTKVGIIVPGKGGNGWDMNDGVCISHWNKKQGFADFSCSANTPEEAIQKYIESVERRLRR